MADFSRPRYEATVITTAFQITGQIEPIGPWLDFLNAKDKITLPVYNAHILTIGTSVGPAPEKPQVVRQSRKTSASSTCPIATRIKRCTC